MECFNCNHTVNGNFCSNCGQSLQLARIDSRYILTSIGDVLSFKKGIFYTIKELLLRPGSSVNAFIKEDRRRLMRPVIFVIFCSFFYTILQRLLGFEDSYVNYSSETPSSAIIIIEWIQGNYGYANILIAVFIAGWLKVLFRKYDYNFYEALIMLLYIFGEGMLIYSLSGVAESLTGISMMAVGGGLGLIYSIWAIGQFYNRKKVLSYVKGLFAYVLGLIVAGIFTVLIGKSIDWLMLL